MAQRPVSLATSLLKIYHYPACSTCKNALKYLKNRGIGFESIHIVENPPSLSELGAMLIAVQAQGGSLKNLFNTSGGVYKEMGLSEKLSALTEAEALSLLSKNGKLIKRPFVVSEEFSTVGFKPELWDKRFQD